MVHILNFKIFIHLRSTQIFWILKIFNLCKFYVFEIVRNLKISTFPMKLLETWKISNFEKWRNLKFSDFLT